MTGKLLGALAIAIIAAAVLVGCGGGNGEGGASEGRVPAEPETHSLAGKVAVEPTEGEMYQALQVARYIGEDGCVGIGGYSDVQEGAQVVVKDGEGAILAVSSLGAGRIVVPPLACLFPFAVEGIPLRDFYSIEVSHRGALSYSYADLEARGWIVKLTLGH